MHGFDTADSHHAMHAFTWDPGGALHWQEGTFHYSQIETPYGPRRCNEAGVFRWEPKTRKFDVFVSYGFANPWGHYIDRWGQNFVADASGGANYYGTAFSGQVIYPAEARRHEAVFPDAVAAHVRLRARLQPSLPRRHTGRLSVEQRHRLPGHSAVSRQGRRLGLFRCPGRAAFEVVRLRTSARSRLQFGPDGALYVVDWFNPLVGHMQHSLRDPNRDHTHGRIWRITYPKRPLLKKPKIAGASVPELLDLLKVLRRPGAVSSPPRAARAARAGGVESARDMDRRASTRAILNTGGRCSRPSGCTRASTRSTWRFSSRCSPAPSHEPGPRPPACSATGATASAIRSSCCASRSTTSTRASGSKPSAPELLRRRPTRPRRRKSRWNRSCNPQDDYLEYTLNETTKTLDHRVKDSRQNQVAEVNSMKPLVLWRRRLVCLLAAGVRHRFGSVGIGLPRSARQPARETAQEQARAGGPPGRDRGDDRQAGHGRRPGIHLPASDRPEASRHQSGSRLSRPWPRPPPTAISARPRPRKLVPLIEPSRRRRRQRSKGRRSGWRASGSSSRGRCAQATGRVAVGGRRCSAPKHSTPWRRSAGRPGARGSRLWPRPVSRRARDCWRSPPWPSSTSRPRLRGRRRSWRSRPIPARDLTPLVAAFLNRQGGWRHLAAALGGRAVPADSAKLALRAVYALGRSDPALVAALSRAAGHLPTETKPLTPSELNQLVRGRRQRRPGPRRAESSAGPT